METPLESSANNHLKPKEEEKEEEDSLSLAMEMLGLNVVPLAVNSAVELGVFDTIAKAGEGAMLSEKEIASQIGSKNPETPQMLDRLLRLLASHSLLRCSVSQQDHSHRLYSLSPRSKYFVTDADDGSSLGPTLALLLDNVFYQSWKGVKGAIMEGFEDIKTLVDVGGGFGVNLHLITSKYPNVKAIINFDLPHVIQHAPLYAGVEHVAGDMFDSVPKGDAIFLKLLRNCHKAIPDDGKVIVVERILPVVSDTTRDAKSSFQSDILMMIQNPPGIHCIGHSIWI
ncbi:hypothetical protein AAHE18_16G107600 [Arachis hypogaea]|nr:Anthranilate N-methyltransferase [Arachis hypogaea]